MAKWRYEPSALPLYGPEAGGPSRADVNQWGVYDCYLEASLAAVATQNPTAIKNMITDNGDGTYGVRFYWNGEARYVTVDNELAVDGGTDAFHKDGFYFNTAPPNGGIWASLVEQAYAEVQTQGYIANWDYKKEFRRVSGVSQKRSTRLKLVLLYKLRRPSVCSGRGHRRERDYPVLIHGFVLGTLAILQPEAGLEKGS